MRVLRLPARLVLRRKSRADILMSCKTAHAVQAMLFFSLCHLLERSNLPEEISFWLSRAAKHYSAWIHIRNDTRLRSDLRALTDPKMPSHSRLPPDANEILKHG